MKQLFCAYFRKNRNWLALVVLCALIFSMVFSLYDLPVESVTYATLLCGFVAVIFFSFSFPRFVKRHRQLADLQDRITVDLQHLPQPKNAIEERYQELIKILFEHQAELNFKADKTRQELDDYYTLWAHQIKTPIAALGLLLQDQPSSQTTELYLELFKIEQYVEMVLHYLRIDSPASDFVFQRYNLEDIVRPAVRKYARMFIQRKIGLTVRELNQEVLTDAKWLGYVIEQVLSNAVKYTPEGSITIYLDDTPSQGQFLVIEDSGWGIAPEDLPRIFEKGFTGYRGRIDQKSTGIGLYLCKLILDKLSHPIQVESVVGKGTQVKIGLNRVELQAK
jgi:signal transduction histidine kinase